MDYVALNDYLLELTSFRERDAMKNHNFRVFILLLLGFCAVCTAAIPVTDGLVLHLDAGALAGMSEGQTVAVWPDLSGTGHDAAGLGDPSYHAGVLNGQPAVRLDGNDCFSCGLATNQNMTIFAVVKGSHYWSLVRWQENGSWFVYHWSSGILIQQENTNLSGPATGLMPDAWNIGAVVVEHGTPDGTATYRNGTLQGTATYNVSWGPLQNLYIGSFNGTGEFTIGDIAELIIYHRALSPAEHQQVGHYLAEKYGLSTNYTDATPMATGPVPGDRTEGHPQDTQLEWQAAEGAGRHLVYLATDETAAATAGPMAEDLDLSGGVDAGDIPVICEGWLDEGAGLLGDMNGNGVVDLDDWRLFAGAWGQQSNIFRGAFGQTVYDPGLLTDNETYYWRVDEEVNGEVYPGKVWTFTVGPDGLDYGILPPEHLYVIDRGSMSNKEFVLIQSLQGIVAQTRPEIFIRNGSSNALWLQEMVSQYGVTTTEVSAVAGTLGPVKWLVDHFRDHFNGYIYYYPDTQPSSVNVATSLAGILKAIPIANGIESIATSLGIPMILDVRYRDEWWMFNNYWQDFNQAALFVHEENIASWGGFQRDWLAATKAMAWWSSNYDQSVQVYSSVVPNSPVYGWDDPSAPGELGAVRFHSQYGMYTSSSNWMLNLSTYAGMARRDPVIEFRQKVRGRTYTHENNVHYVTFVMSDMDNVNVLFNAGSWAQGSSYYGSPHRGSFNMGWGMPPSLVKLGPAVMKWWYDNATEKDGFIGYSSGLGYFYPAVQQDLATHIRQLGRYMEWADLRALSILDYWWPSAMTQAGYAHIGNLYASIESLRGFFYADVNGDYARYGAKILWFNGKPMITCRHVLWEGAMTPAQLIAAVNSYPTDPTNPQSYTYVIVHAWSMNMDDVAEAVAGFDSDVRVVNPEEFIEQVRYFEPGK